MKVEEFKETWSGRTARFLLVVRDWFICILIHYCGTDVFSCLHRKARMSWETLVIPRCATESGLLMAALISAFVTEKCVWYRFSESILLFFHVEDMFRFSNAKLIPHTVWICHQRCQVFKPMWRHWPYPSCKRQHHNLAYNIQVTQNVRKGRGLIFNAFLPHPLTEVANLKAAFKAKLMCAAIKSHPFYSLMLSRIGYLSPARSMKAPVTPLLCIQCLQTNSCGSPLKAFSILNTLWLQRIWRKFPLGALGDGAARTLMTGCPGFKESNRLPRSPSPPPPRHSESGREKRRRRALHQLPPPHTTPPGIAGACGIKNGTRWQTKTVLGTSPLCCLLHCQSMKRQLWAWQ